MPLEIRELVIKASIKEGEQSTNTGSNSSSPSTDQTELINACVEQVLSILKERAER